MLSSKLQRSNSTNLDRVDVRTCTRFERQIVITRCFRTVPKSEVQDNIVSTNVLIESLSFEDEARAAYGLPFCTSRIIRLPML